MRSVTRTAPLGVSWTVSRTRDSSRYRRVLVAGPAGPSSQRPFSRVPTRAAKHAGESKWGRQSQSMDPALLTSAAVSVSPRRA
jgi:hypothetical protein